MHHFSYKDARMFAEDVDLQKIAQEIGTPFYCYSTATLKRHYEVFANALEGLDYKICFASKSNTNLAVLKTLFDCGAGADVVSAGEIEASLQAGAKASEIVFSGVGKTRAEIEYALAKNIWQFNVESEVELDLINEVAGEMIAKAPIAIRVNPDVDPKTHAKISTGQKESKFGISIDRAMDVYEYARSLENIKVQGVSVHIGSQLTSLEPFKKAFEITKQFVLDLRAAGYEIETLDLGGGLGIPYETKKSNPPLPDDYGKMVKEIFADLNVKLIFEPGRLIAGNAGILVSEVIYVKQTPTKNFLILDAAMNDLLRPSMYDAYHEFLPVSENKSDEITYDIVGPVCETGDIFAQNRKLPKLGTGDLVAIMSAGAYGAVMSNTYNMRPLVSEVIVNGSEFFVTRERQKLEDILSAQKIPDWP